MLKKVIKYEDFDGNQREEEFWFGLTKAELVDLQLSSNGGLEKEIERIIAAQETSKLMEIFKRIIYMSYGVKSADGKRFDKSEAVKQDFIQSQAYSDLYIELISDTEAALKFIVGIMPNDKDISKDDMMKQIKAEQESKLKLLENN